jgi:hypothetical protein
MVQQSANLQAPLSIAMEHGILWMKDIFDKFRASLRPDIMTPAESGIRIDPGRIALRIDHSM